MVEEDQSKMGLIGDRIRSIKIVGKFDKFIRVYEHSNFEGKYKDYFEDTASLGSLDKKVTSFSFTSDPKRKNNPQPLTKPTNSGCYSLYDIKKRFPGYLT